MNSITIMGSDLSVFNPSQIDALHNMTYRTESYTIKGVTYSGVLRNGGHKGASYFVIDSGPVTNGVWIYLKVYFASFNISDNSLKSTWTDEYHYKEVLTYATSSSTTAKTSGNDNDIGFSTSSSLSIFNIIYKIEGLYVVV